MSGHHGPSLTPFLLKKGDAFTHMASCSSLLGRGSIGSFAAWASKVLGLPTVGLQKRLPLRIWLARALLQTRLFQCLQGAPEIMNSSPRAQKLLRTMSNPQAQVLEKPDGPLRKGAEFTPNSPPHTLLPWVATQPRDCHCPLHLIQEGLRDIRAPSSHLTHRWSFCVLSGSPTIHS